jgi:hypothetical protein
METTKIRQIAKDSIKMMVKQEIDGKVTELDFYIRSMVNCWDMDGFKSKQEAFYAYNSYLISRRIRVWCRRNRFTTRKGSYHSFDGRRPQEREIWNIVSCGAMDDNTDNVQWSWRNVDGLKNVYVWFK